MEGNTIEAYLLRVYGMWERIEDEKQKQNLTNKTLAKRCCLGYRGVRMLNEQYNPKLCNFVKICNGLNVSADYLLYGRESSIDHIQPFAIDDMWKRIENERKNQNLSKNELAKKCRFSSGNLSGSGNIYLPYFARLCAELNVSADYILFGNKNNSGNE